MGKEEDKFGYQNILVPIISFVIGIPVGFLVIYASLMLTDLILRLSFGYIGVATAYLIALVILSLFLGGFTRYTFSYFVWKDELTILIVLPVLFWVYSFNLISDPMLGFISSSFLLLLVLALVTIVPFLFVLLFHYRESEMPD